MLHRDLADSKAGDEKVINTAFKDRNVERASLRGKSGKVILVLFMQVARNTRPDEGHFKVWTFTFSWPRLKQGYPLYSPYASVSSIRSLAGRAESTTSPKFMKQSWLSVLLKYTSVTTGPRAYTLLVKHKSLNLVLLTISNDTPQND